LLRQPANTWSNLAFTAAGVAGMMHVLPSAMVNTKQAGAQGEQQQQQQQQAETQQLFGAFVALFGLSQLAVGLGRCNRGFALI